MLSIALPTALLLGLASSLHCFAMCGGIIGALSMGLAVNASSAPRRRRVLVIAFNCGRVLSYAVAGAIAGAGGALLLAGAGRLPLHLVLQLVAGALLLLIGLHLGGWFPALKIIESLGSRLWRVLAPAGRLFLPVDNLPKALLVGALWGWLPCGLVYSVLAWTAAQADPVFGAAAMAAFGLGTLPGMTVAGLAAQNLRPRVAGRALRRAAALLVMALALWSIWLALGAADTAPGAHLHS